MQFLLVLLVFFAGEITALVFGFIYRVKVSEHLLYSDLYWVCEGKHPLFIVNKTNTVKPRLNDCLLSVEHLL